VSNHGGEMAAVSVVDETGVEIKIYTSKSDMEHAWYFRDKRTGEVISSEAGHIRLEILKEYDALAYLDMLESVIHQARVYLIEKHEDQANNLHDWHWKIKKRDGKCMICGRTEQLEAHHIEARNYANTLELSLANGVALCHEHHDEFHKIYGKGNNDAKQLMEYRLWKETGEPICYLHPRGTSKLDNYVRRLKEVERKKKNES
jgi:hypothetical protein